MPLDLKTKLQIAQSDPALITWIFNGGVPSEDLYLFQRLGGNFLMYEEMLIDPQVSGKLDERVGALLGRSVLVDAASDSKGDTEAAKTARRILDIPEDPDKKQEAPKKGRPTIPYEGICRNWLYSGLLCGFAVQAIREWQQVDSKLIVPILEFVPQRRFIFQYYEPDNKDVYVCTDEPLDPAKDIVLVCGYELRLLTKRSPLFGERCPKDRFLVYTFGSVKGLPWGLGLGYRIRKFWEIRKEVLKSGVLTGDRLGSPPTHGTYPIDMNPNNPDHAIILSSFNRLLKAISPNAYAATTDGFKIEFPASELGHEVLKWLYDTAELEISRAVWGEGSYAEKDTGSYSAENQQAQNRNENVIDSDANTLDEGPCSQLWELIGKLNWPNANDPIIRRETYSERRRLEQRQQEEEKAEERRASRANTDQVLLLNIGLTTTDEYIKATYGEEWTLPEQPPQQPTDSSVDSSSSDVTADSTVDSSDTQQGDSADTASNEDFATHVDRFLDWNGLRIGLRYPPGATRFPQYRNAKKLQSGYGFLQGYKVNGKAARCYVYPGLLKGETGGDKIYAIAQLTKDATPDEDKLMIGYPSQESAELAYRREMPSEFFGGIRPFNMSDLGHSEPIEMEPQ